MRRNAFERKKKKLGLKFNPGLAGANQPSNNLARLRVKRDRVWLPSWSVL